MKESRDKMPINGKNSKAISLEEVLEHYKNALEQTALLVITDAEGRITYANRAFCHLSGYSLEELLSNTHSIIKSGSHSQSFYKDLWDALKSGKEWRGSFTNRKKNGEFFYLESAIFPFPAAPETPFQFLSVSRERPPEHDVTTTVKPQANKKIITTKVDNGQIQESLKRISGSLELLTASSTIGQKQHINFLLNQVKYLENILKGFSAEDKSSENNAGEINGGEKPEEAPMQPLIDNLKVLIAEDVEINQLVIQKHLENMRFSCDFAADGITVLKKLDISTYDIVLMDMQMPLMDGSQAIKRIRNSRASFQNIPIIALSASITGDARSKCLEAGADDYLPKPVNVSELNSRIFNLVMDKRKNTHMKNISDRPSIEGQEPLINLEYLEQLSEGDEEFTTSMIKYFIDNTPEVLTSMQESYKQKDWIALRNIAHKFKPQLNFMGINSLLDDIEQLEQNAHKEKNLDTLPVYIQKAERVCNAAIKQLESMLEERMDK